MKGILGKKIGMSQLFLNTGVLIPVTIIEIQPNLVSQVKNNLTDKYTSLQLSTFDIYKKNNKKPLIGHFKKADSKPKKFIKEIRNMCGFNYKDIINIDDIFRVGEFVDVQSISKGKGFTGRIKRYNQSRGPMSHGSGLHRQMGSTGAISANRVFKLQPMPGQKGNVKCSVINLEIIQISKENHYLVIKGSVPGPKKSNLIIKHSIKKNIQKNPVSLFIRNSINNNI